MLLSYVVIVRMSGKSKPFMSSFESTSPAQTSYLRSRRAREDQCIYEIITYAPGECTVLVTGAKHKS
jgi:hypothetical protein